MSLKIEKYEKIGLSKYRLYLDNGEVIDTYDDVILKNELLLKKEIDNYLYQTILTESKVQEHYNSCIKYIGIRIRSTKEIIDYLKRKNVEDEDIEYIIEKLTKDKLLDDNRFCECFIKDKLKFTTMGEYKIIFELKKHNINTNIIEKNRYLITNDIMIEKIDKAINKQLNSKKTIDKQKLRNKLYNHLLNAGYNSNLIVQRLNIYF
jgi:regulatory protein